MTNQKLTRPGFVNLGEALVDRWPSALPQLPEGTLLDHIWASTLESDFEEGVVRAGAELLLEDEIVLTIPGVDALGIAIASVGGDTVLPVEVTILPNFSITLRRIPIALRLKSDLLRPATREPGASPDQAPRWVADTSQPYIDITLAEVTITVDAEGDITLELDGGIDLPPCMIGDSGAVVEARDISLHFAAAAPPPGQPAGWKGIHMAQATLHLPGELSATVGTLSLTDAYIGNGGFTGAVSTVWTPALAAELFGIDVTLSRAEIEFVQNAPVTFSLVGTITLPFFDQAVGVDLEVGLDGSIGIIASAVQPAGASNASGLLEFTKPDLLSMRLDSLGFSYDDGLFTALLSGTLTPLVGGLDWPGFQVQELSIDSEGNVRLEGGWLSLPGQYSLDFYGFTIAITRLGMGNTDDGGRWIGFSGSIKLVDGIGLGGSVDGLRIAWYPDGSTSITLEGVGVELEIPETLRFKGSVSYHELPGPQHRFDGDITLELLAIDLKVDGKIVIGTDTNVATGERYNFFALFIGVELPAGIPLWATGLGLYGIAGLVAIQMAPNKGALPNVLHPTSGPDEEWFENADGSPGWFKRDPVGITDLRSKWDPVQNGFALGGGVTIGTVADNGFTFSGALLLVISFPGPVILLEGKANLLKERSSLDDEPIFRALAVLDFRAGELLVGLMARYKFGDAGELIDIAGSAEAFFDFHDPSRWHLYLGVKDPKERRIRAEILTLFEANAYFMLDARRLQMGAWVGFDERWSFGPLKVTLEAWIEGGVVLSWKPIYFHGELWLHGKAELSVFGFGFGLSVDARFSADVFDPFHVLAEFSVGIGLPWPLPDFEVGITLEWGPTPEVPPLPLPLKEIAVEHFKSTASWPLPRASLLLPDADSGNGYLIEPPPAAPIAAGPPDGAPVIPMDARPHITFGRAVHDDALVGVNPQPVLPAAVPPGWERVGDPEANQGPMRVRFSLQEVSLAKWNGAAWTDVARKATTPNPPGLKELYGSWAPIPQLPSGLVTPGTDPPVAQVKLWLWSKTPFDYSRHGGRAWEEWFTDEFSAYPCIPRVPDRTICCDVDGLPVGTVITLPHPCRRYPEILFVGSSAIVQQVAPQHGHVHALCFSSRRDTDDVAVPPGSVFGVLLTGDPASRMRLVFSLSEAKPERHCVGFDRLNGPEVPMPHRNRGVELSVFAGRRALRSTRVVTLAGRRGIDISERLEVDLECSATRVDLMLFQQASPVEVAGVDEDGRVVATAKGPDRQGVVQVQLVGGGIVTVEVKAPQDETTLLQLCYECAGHPVLEAEAIGVDVNGGRHGPFMPVGDTITVDVDELRSVLVRGKGPVCLLEVCVTFPPDEDAVSAAENMQQRLVDAMALWSDVGEVLEADTDYRVRVVTKVEGVGEGALAGTNPTHDVTELAYFRTQGPPAIAALSTPVHHPPAESFDSGLDDLARYVAQTVPVTVPAHGEQALLPRPVYRAYDVGAVFNEDYVDHMYRLAKRDLLLYMYDSNNQPVRDAAGRLIVSSNRWGITESLTLSESTVRYLSVLDQSECVIADPTVIPHQVTLFVADPGLVLEPDIVHEARLIPLLLHEDFSDGLAGWTVVDQGTNQGPSVWTTIGHRKLEGAGATAAGTIVTLTGADDLAGLDPAVDVVILSTDSVRPSKAYRVLTVDNAQKQITVDGAPALFGGSSPWTVPGWSAVLQTSNIWGGVNDATNVPRPGTMLVGGDETWTDYRYTAQLRSGDDDAIGVVFRYKDASNYYRFSMDRERRYRRLVGVTGGVAAVLAADDYVFTTDQDYVITVEVIGESLRVYQDSALVFDVRDPSSPAGKVGFYCWANVNARFNDVRVDDFRRGAPVAYRFSFTTSHYANVFHHLHSFQDETWVTEAVDGNLAGEFAAAVAPVAAVKDAESRAYSSFATKVLGQSAQKASACVEVHRVTVVGETVALLLRSSEPIDWTRTSLQLLHAGGPSDSPRVPGAVKLTDVVTSGTAPNDEAVTALARERINLAGTQVEALTIPGPLVDAPEAPLLDDEFTATGGLLFAETFGVNALDTYRIVDAPGAITGPSAWSVSGGVIRQTSNVYSGSIEAIEATKIGTVAITGPRIANLRLTAVLRSTDDDAIGVVFRYDDDANWYRFSMDSERAYRRLVKCVAGTVSVLWEDHAIYDQGSAYEVRIEAYGDLILGYQDRALLFVVRDGDVKDGQVGLYCWANVGAAFETLRVEALDAPPLLFQAPLQDASELTVVDSGYIAGPSAWTVADGEVRQTSRIHGETIPPGPLKPGTVAIIEPTFADALISLRLGSSEAGAIGVVFRYADSSNWYRFSMEATTPYRRLVKCEGGVVSVLKQDSTAFALSTTHNLTVFAEGRRLEIWLDGVNWFTTIDAGPSAGRIGMYCCDNDAATFSQVVVTDPSRRIGAWQIFDEPTIGQTSVWQMGAGVLKAMSNTIASWPPEAVATMAVSDVDGLDDCRIVCRMRSDDDDAIGLAFRWRDPRNYYRLSSDSERSYRRLVKLVDGVVTVLWEDTNAFTVGTAFTLTVDVTGSRIVAYQGGERLFDVIDDAHPTGRVGLYCWANSGARFEGVIVTTPPLGAFARFRDHFGVGDVSDWTIVDEGTQSAPSNWGIADGTLRQTSNIYSLPLAPADVAKRGTLALAGEPTWTDYVLTAVLMAMDDDAFGLVFRYQDGNNFYRFSMDRERTYRRVVKCSNGVFTTLWEDGVAYETGRAYELTIACVGRSLFGWLDGIPLFEVEDAELATGRIGLYCWAQVDCRFSNVRVFGPDQLRTTFLAEDDFEFETAGLWTYSTAGDQEGPGLWQTTGGELQQTSNVWGGDAFGTEPALPGTLALAGDETWKNYRVTVCMASDDDDAIGVVVRYQDADNWYRFSMDRERAYRRLVKCVAGVTSELWSDNFVFEIGREYLVTVDVLDDAIAGYMDGMLAFTVRDSAVTSGGVGLYCWANTGARFQSVRVSAAGWTTHYRFSLDEEPVAAGTRIVIHSGNERDWTIPPQPGLAHRFLTTMQDPGRRHFAANLPVMLRLKDARGTPGHGRRFLDQSHYAALPAAEVLRGADGLEVAILLPAATALGSHFEEDNYRLTLVYRRDNQAVDPASTLLSQAGDTSDEMVRLDIPWGGVV